MKCIDVVKLATTFPDFNGGDWDETGTIYTDEGHEFEYQFRDYPNGDFCSILVRFSPMLNDIEASKCYIEFYPENEDFENLILTVVSEETIERLDRIYWHRRHPREIYPLDRKE